MGYQAVSAEIYFAVRIMRVLVAMNFVGEDDEELYSATPLTVQMCLPAYQACIKHQ